MYMMLNLSTWPLAAMKKLVETHRVEIEKFTDLSMDELTSLTYLYEFDRVVQCAAWGYPTEDAYYRDASSVDAVTAIRIPYLAINCTDDPVSLCPSTSPPRFDPSQTALTRHILDLRSRVMACR